jgi:putative ABC transport system ATP-binding protein
MIAALKRLFGRREPSERAPPAVIALAGVSRTFDDGAIVALKSVDLEIDPGECLAILGPSGSGKSSIVNLLSGIDLPSGGRVLWNGRPVTSRRAWARLRRKDIGIVFQEFHLLPTLTARENVEMALMGHGIPAEERRERAEAALGRVGLAHRGKHLPHALSGGERQRVAIARAIVNAPRLLLADEPTGNLDSASTEAVADLLFNLQRDTGMTLVLVTHDEHLAARCRRCVRIRDGEVADDRVLATVVVPPIAETEPAVTDAEAPAAVTTAAPAEPAPAIAEATAAIARTVPEVAR